MKLSSVVGVSLLLAATVLSNRGNATEHDAPVAVSGGACKSLALFTSSAAPALQKDGCLSCHAGTNPSATTALDLTKVGKNDQVACASVLGKVNLANKPQSSILQTVTGTGPHLGGKVADASSYTSALLVWINAE
jgi:hypothetical protein